MKRLLIAGCGDLGQRLAARLAPDQWQVTGLRRSPETLPAGILPLAADLTRPDTLQALPESVDALIYQATPAERTPAAYRAIYIEGLANLLARTRADRLIVVSSTAVYGQDDGQWVDEDSPAEPTAFNGHVLLEAEDLARNAGGQVVRFSGIYGPGRDFLLRQLKSGRASCRPAPPQWTNRIHADDAAAVLSHLLQRPAESDLYCASDLHPTPRCEVLDWLADAMGCPRASRRHDDPAAGDGKRVSCRRLLATGFAFTYPDYRAGYSELTEACRTGDLSA